MRISTTGLLGLVLVGLPSSLLPNDSQNGSKLDPSGSYFLAPFVRSTEPVVKAKLEGEVLSFGLEDYERFLLARADRRFFEDFAFVRLVTLECKKRGLARSAPALAKANALRNLRRRGTPDPNDILRRALENAELQRMRIDALVRQDRRLEARDLRLAFDTRYGLDGVRVELRQILISRVSTKRRLQESGIESPTDAAIDVAAKARATDMQRSIRAGTSTFDSLRAMSDDPTTRTRLDDPRTVKRAAVLEGYDYQRYGTEFAKAVRALEVGEISAPVKTSHGYHIIELLSRVVTKYADVEADLRKALRAEPASTRETEALKKQLFERYAIEFVE